MNKLYTLALALFSVGAIAQDGAPAAPYYNGFNFEQRDNALKNALATKTIQEHVIILNYQQAERALQAVDVDPEDTRGRNLLLLYGFSDNICPSATGDDNDHRRRDKYSDGAGNTCEWNREHVYAQSLGTPSLGQVGAGADAHHLRASDVERNAQRGNKKFTDGAGNSGDVNSAWYPGDEWKGDVARILMYMYLRYNTQCLPKNVVIGNTVATDNNMPELLLKWNAEDPVSQYEDNRNSYLGDTFNDNAQGNRNPFIDNPYLATLIWGGPVAQDRWGLLSNTDVFSATVSVYPNPAVNNEVSIYSEIVLDGIQLINVNGQIIQSIQKPQANNNTYKVSNLPQGFYMVKLSSGSQATTKKLIVN